MLQTGTRLVVEDVLVLDAQGNPVHGLPQSAFHVFDDRKPQRIRHFQEGVSHTGAAGTKTPVLPPGTFSNASYLSSSDTASEVLLIDADSLELTDQMFLLQQLGHALDALPTGEQASVFCVRSGRPIQLRGFTTDRQDLRRASTECVPSMQVRADDTFVSAVTQLNVVAATLQPLPGRKDLLWFAGPFPFIPVSNDEVGSDAPTVDLRARNQTICEMQNMLAEARISVFPIDPRGVVIGPMAGAGTPVAQVVQSRSPAATSNSSRLTVPDPLTTTDATRYGYMQQIAEATGGEAYHLNNLRQEIEQVLQAGKSAYTLSYSPGGYTSDQSWHKVRITVDGLYRVSYRRGYLATFSGGQQPGSSQQTGGGQPSEGSRPFTLAAANATASSLPSPGTPLLFEVHTDPPLTSNLPGVTAEHKKPGSITVSIAIPVQQLGFLYDGHLWTSKAVVSAYAYDDMGRLKGGDEQELTSSLTEEQWKAQQGRKVQTLQSFVLPRSAHYVLFVVEDHNARRRGTLMLPARALQPGF